MISGTVPFRSQGDPAEETSGISFVVMGQPPEVLEPAVGPFDFPAPFQSPAGAAVLRRGSLPPPAMGANQLDSAVLPEPFSQGITASRLIVQQMFGDLIGERECAECGLHRFDFTDDGRSDVTASGVPCKSTRSTTLFPLPTAFITHRYFPRNRASVQAPIRQTVRLSGWFAVARFTRGWIETS